MTIKFKWDDCCFNIKLTLDLCKECKRATRVALEKCEYSLGMVRGVASCSGNCSRKVSFCA